MAQNSPTYQIFTLRYKYDSIFIHFEAKKNKKISRMKPFREFLAHVNYIFSSEV